MGFDPYMKNSSGISIAASGKSKIRRFSFSILKFKSNFQIDKF